ncbi:MAG: hypothetical protein L0212_04045 [Acidobacteria bacterium]|nr:hypothetical protein [Acidobacteriota bacterium]
MSLERYARGRQYTADLHRLGRLTVIPFRLPITTIMQQDAALVVVPVSLVLVPALEEMAHGRAITVQQFCAETLEAAIVAYRQHPAVREQRHADLEAVRREEAMTSYSFRSSRAPAPGGSVFSPHPGNGKRP